MVLESVFVLCEVEMCISIDLFELTIDVQMVNSATGRRLPMTLVLESYRDRICNNYLNLYRTKVSAKDKEEIIYCLLHQSEVALWIRLTTANLVGSSIAREDLPAEIPGLFGKPILLIFDE